MADEIAGSEHERISVLEEALPDIREDLSSLSEVLSELTRSVGLGEESALADFSGILRPPLQLGSSFVFASPRSPQFLALAQIVNTTAQGKCNETIVTQKLGPGKWFVHVKNTGTSCNVTIKIGATTLPKADKGGKIGGGEVTVPPRNGGAQLNIKCAGTAGSDCSIEYQLTRL
jgi:hypothetical protein